MNALVGLLIPALISGIVDYLRKHPELIDQLEQRASKILKDALPDFPDFSKLDDLAGDITRQVIAQLPHIDEVDDIARQVVDDIVRRIPLLGGR